MYIMWLEVGMKSRRIVSVPFYVVLSPCVYFLHPQSSYHVIYTLSKYTYVVSFHVLYAMLHTCTDRHTRTYMHVDWNCKYTCNIWIAIASSSRDSSVHRYISSFTLFVLFSYFLR